MNDVEELRPAVPARRSRSTAARSARSSRRPSRHATRSATWCCTGSAGARSRSARRRRSRVVEQRRAAVLVPRRARHARPDRVRRARPGRRLPGGRDGLRLRRGRRRRQHRRPARRAARRHARSAAPGRRTRSRGCASSGFDAAFDYHDGPVAAARCAAAAPDGIDVYFDNVGGEHLEAAIGALKVHGRAAICGMIAAYNATEPPAAPRNLMQVVGKRLRLEGLLVQRPRRPDARVPRRGRRCARRRPAAGPRDRRRGHRQRGRGVPRAAARRQHREDGRPARLIQRRLRGCTRRPVQPVPPCLEPLCAVPACSPVAARGRAVVCRRLGAPGRPRPADAAPTPAASARCCPTARARRPTPPRSGRTSPRARCRRASPSQAELYNAGRRRRRPGDAVQGLLVPARERRRSADRPRAGRAHPARRRRYQVPRVYGDTRADTMFGAGLRRGAGPAVLHGRAAPHRRGPAVRAARAGRRRRRQRRARHAGPVAGGADGRGARTCRATRGAEGARALQDLRGLRRRRQRLHRRRPPDPRLLPGEYPALGAMPEAWTLADTAATGYLLIGQFTAFGGGEAQQVDDPRGAAGAARGSRAGAQVYADLRRAEDPETTFTTTQRFPSDDPGPVDPRARAVVDPGSYVLRDAGRSRRPAAERVAGRACPPWAQDARDRDGLALTKHASNAVLVDGASTRASGHPLAVTGPAGRLLLAADPRRAGAARARASQVVGHDLPGRRAVPADRPRPGLRLDRHVRLRRQHRHLRRAALQRRRLRADAGVDAPTATAGRCVAVHQPRAAGADAGVADDASGPRGEVVLRTLRSVHGPVQGFGTVGGKPVALTFTSGVYKQAIQLAGRLPAAGREPGDARRSRSRRRCGCSPATRTGSTATAAPSPGCSPAASRPARRASTSTSRPGAPAPTTGRASTPRPSATARCRRRRTRGRSTRRGLPGVVEQPGRPRLEGDRPASGATARRSARSLLERPLKGRIAKGKVGLADVAKVNAGAGTRDLRGYDVLPQLLAVLGTPSAADKPVVDALRAWQRTGAHRRSVTGGASYDDSARRPRLRRLVAAGRPGRVRARCSARSCSTQVGRDELLPLDAAPTAAGLLRRLAEPGARPTCAGCSGSRCAAGQSRTYCGGGDRARCRAACCWRGLRRRGRAGGEDAGERPTCGAWRKPVLCPDAPAPATDHARPWPARSRRRSSRGRTAAATSRPSRCRGRVPRS